MHVFAIKPQILDGRVTLACIGGSVFDFGEEIFCGSPKVVITPGVIPTPFDWSDGLIPGNINIYKSNGKNVAVINRHGPDHGLLPHEIPYRTIIYTLRKIGVEFITGFCASGSVNSSIPVGSLAIPTQFIDRTQGRCNTFFGQGFGGHIAGSDPFCPESTTAIATALKTTGETVITQNDLEDRKDPTIVVIQGPRFSTRAESKMFAILGGDIICMTPYPEGILALEAGMCYVVVMIITDVDAGNNPDHAVNVEQVLKVLKKKNQMMPQYIDVLTKEKLPGPECRCHELVCGALQSKGQLTEEQHMMFDLFTEIHNNHLSKKQ